MASIAEQLAKIRMNTYAVIFTVIYESHFVVVD